MSKTLRLSETWFRRGLWLVAFLFAWFLTGLGGRIVSDLPKIEQTKSLEDFIAPAPLQALKKEQEQAALTAKQADTDLEQARLQEQVASSNSRVARESFAHWLATRKVTGLVTQDQALISRNVELDAVYAAQRAARSRVEQLEQTRLNAQQTQTRASQQIDELHEHARQAWSSASRMQELRVFGYRLAFTLPLLILAAYLFKKYRKSPSWPFVWGFVLFALLTFFVELVPYLPSYGGYVRYLVGILITIVGGRYAIQALQAYLERQKLAEAQPAQLRHKELDYDAAQMSLSQNICPGCERSLATKEAPHDKLDFCPHCGLSLFDHCAQCGTRKNAFARYCFACGATAKTSTSPTALAST